MNTEIIEKRTGLKFKRLSKGVKHQIGKTYYSGYWGSTYEVIDYKEKTGDWMGWSVTCKWQDGHITTHCTDLSIIRDFEVIK